MTRYGYARVSTLKQDLTEQIAEIKAKGVPEANIYAEKMTGTRSNRPQWLKLMNTAKPGDEIIVTKLDRLGRSLQVILQEINQLTNKKVTVTVGNMSFDRTTPTGKLMLNVMASFAEFERDMIVDRMQGARAYKRKNDKDYREGRKRKLTPEMVDAMRDYYKTHTQKETAKAFNVSPRTVGNYLGKPGRIIMDNVDDFAKALLKLNRKHNKAKNKTGREINPFTDQAYSYLLMRASTKIPQDPALSLTWDSIDFKQHKIKLATGTIDIPNRLSNALGDLRNKEKNVLNNLFVESDANHLFSKLSKNQEKQLLKAFSKETGAAIEDVKKLFA